MARETTAILASFLKPLGSRNVKLSPSVCPPLPRPRSGGTVPQLSQPTHPSLVTSEPSLSLSLFFPLGSGWASQLALACTGGGVS